MTETQTHQDFEARQPWLIPFPKAESTANDAVNCGNAVLYTVKDIRLEFGVSDKQARNYASTVKEAYPWLLDDLKDGRKYTQLMINKIREFKSSGLNSADWVKAVHKENADLLPSEPEPQPESTVLAQAEVCNDKLDLPSSIVAPIEGTNRLSLARHNLSENQQALNSKLANIQNLLNEHQRQQADSKKGFAVNLENRKAQLLLQVAEQALQDKLEADRLYEAILLGDLSGLSIDSGEEEKR